jgi:hypothetical protein
VFVWVGLLFRLVRMCGAKRESALPTDVFWGSEYRHSGAVRTRTLARDRSTCATVGCARRPSRCIKRDCWPCIWLTVQALRVGVGDDLALWRRYCRPCSGRRLKARWCVCKSTATAEPMPVFCRQISRHRIPGALALVGLWATAAAEVSVCSDPSERMMIVWTFFGFDAGTDGAVTAGGATAGGGAEGAGRRVVGSEEISASGLSAGQRETNFSLELALTMDVWLELLVRASP